MKKIVKIFILSAVLLFTLTGCLKKLVVEREEYTKVNKLSNEDKKINQEKIKSLANKFNDVEVIYIDRNLEKINCVCTRPIYLDGPGCLESECETVPNNYEWNYKICSNNIKGYCAFYTFSDLSNRWNFDDSDIRSFNFYNDFAKVLNNNNIKYKIFANKAINNNANMIIVKEDDMLLANILRNYFDNNKLDNHSAYIMFNIIIIDSSISYVLDKINSDCLGSSSINQCIAYALDRNYWTFVVQKNKLGPDMYACNSKTCIKNKFKQIVYRLTFGEYVGTNTTSYIGTDAYVELIGIIEANKFEY